MLLEMSKSHMTALLRIADEVDDLRATIGGR
jgi:hypothetical protein